MSDEPQLSYLTLPDDVGAAPPFIRDESGLDVPNPRAGEPDPITSIGLSIPVTTLVKDDTGREHFVDVASRCSIVPSAKLGPPEQLVDDDHVFARARIIPGTRVVETDHPAVQGLLREAGYVDCDPPKSEQSKTARESKED